MPGKHNEIELYARMHFKCLSLSERSLEHLGISWNDLECSPGSDGPGCQEPGYTPTHKQSNAKTTTPTNAHMQTTPRHHAHTETTPTRPNANMLEEFIGMTKYDLGGALIGKPRRLISCIHRAEQHVFEPWHSPEGLLALAEMRLFAPFDCLVRHKWNV